MQQKQAMDYMMTIRKKTQMNEQPAQLPVLVPGIELPENDTAKVAKLGTRTIVI